MSTLITKEKYQNQISLPKGYKFAGIEVYEHRKQWFVYVIGTKIKKKTKK